MDETLDLMQKTSDEWSMINFTPEKSKQIALARLDLIQQWKDFRRKSTNKLI